MSRTVSAATEAKLAGDTEPGYFVEIQFPSGIVRFTSRDTDTWNGGVWIAAAIKVSGIEGGGQRGSIEYFDADAAMRTLILADGINDVRVRIWKYYAGALATADPAMIFDGVGDGASIKASRVAIGLTRSGSRTVMSPRHRIGPGTGFNFLPPEGTVIQWAGRTLRLERNRG